MYKYAQIDDAGTCVSISYLASEVNGPHMIKLAEISNIQPGDIYQGGSWTRPEPEPLPEPIPSETERIAQLENESAMLALELMDTQIRLEQSEQDQANLLLELAIRGVL